MSKSLAHLPLTPPFPHWGEGKGEGEFDIRHWRRLKEGPYGFSNSPANKVPLS
jgi:hypothetical protein